MVFGILNEAQPTEVVSHAIVVVEPVHDLLKTSF
jgi:hypothetical protein